MKQVAPLRLIPVIGTVVFALSFFVPGEASAATVDVLVDSTDVQLSSEDGKKSGKLTLANISDAAVTLNPSIPGDPGCSVRPDPKTVESGRRTQIVLNLEGACDVEEGADLDLQLGSSVTPASYTIKLAPPTQAKPNWAILGWSFFFGSIAASIVLALTWYRLRALWGASVPQVPQLPQGPKWKAHLKHIWDVIALRWIEFWTGSWFAGSWSFRKTELKSLKTDWSFKDSWVGNITVGSAALLALLSSSTVLKAVLGAEPEAALGLLTVASLLAALFVALAPLLLKIFGDELANPNVLGLFAGALMTLSVTLGLTSVATWQGWELAPGAGTRTIVTSLGVLVALILIWYASDTLDGLVTKAVKSPAAEIDKTLFSARILDAATRHQNFPMPPTGHDASDNQALSQEFEKDSYPADMTNQQRAALSEAFGFRTTDKPTGVL